ncbi:MAG TPA: hypothetical protein DCZ72_08560 [Armatimonadetes bacterium]|nr:hypothetical protein [Armatimonadota bacterium]
MPEVREVKLIECAVEPASIELIDDGSGIAAAREMVLAVVGCEAMAIGAGLGCVLAAAAAPLPLLTVAAPERCTEAGRGAVERGSTVSAVGRETMRTLSPLDGLGAAAGP